MTDIVVGSGPSGVAVAQGLLAAGRRVLMLDAGETLEADREALRARLGATEPDAWTKADVAEVIGYRKQGGGGIRRYGSDYMFRDPEGFSSELPDWLATRPSFAKGGLSNTWGSAVMPYRQEDMGGWPITAKTLAPHYAAVARFMPIAGPLGMLARLFPADAFGDLERPEASRQAHGLFNRLKERHDALKREGVFYGMARQAVSEGCRLCGLCLQGCPYELIFKAQSVVAAMSANPAFEYRKAARVTGFAQNSPGATVWSGGEAIHGDRLFLATGVLPTAQLVLSSLARDAELVMKDSQHLFLPMLRTWSNGEDPAWEDRHTLAQLFVEMIDPAVSPYTIHAQLYTYNEFYAADMKARYGKRAPFLGPLFEALARRLIVAQMFLHSDHSHQVAFSLGADDKLRARLIENAATLPVATAARAKFAKAMGKSGVIPLIRASRLEPVGSSFHSGGTLPMRAKPTGLETDRFGRIAGLADVHVVDASVLPAIPATTITYSVMANAHRIGATAPLIR